MIFKTVNEMNTYKDRVTEGRLVSFAHFLGRPGYALKGAIQEASSDIVAGRSINWKDVGSAAAAGMGGRIRPMWNDIYGMFGVKGIKGLGFASEILLDPLNLVGPGFVKGAGKALSKASSIIKPGLVKHGAAITDKVFKMGPAGAAIKKVSSALGKMGDEFVNLFSTTTSNKKYNSYKAAAEGMRAYREKIMTDYSATMLNQTQNVSKKTGRPIQDTWKRIDNMTVHNDVFGDSLSDISKNTPDAHPFEIRLARTWANLKTNLLKGDIDALSSNIIHGKLAGKIKKGPKPAGVADQITLVKTKNIMRALREEKISQFGSARKKVVEDLYAYTDKKIAEHTANLQARKGALTGKIDKFYSKQFSKNAAQLDELTKSHEALEQEMYFLQRQIAKNERLGIATNHMTLELAKKEAKYYTMIDDITDLVYKLPEVFPQGHRWIREIDKINTILRDVDIDIGKRGGAFVTKINKLEKMSADWKKLPYPSKRMYNLAGKIATMRARLDLNYTPRILSSEALELAIELGKRPGTSAKKWLPRLQSAFKSRTREFGTVDEVNKFFRENGAPYLDGKLIETFFSENLPNIMYKRGIGSARAISNKEFLKGLAQFGVKEGEEAMAEAGLVPFPKAFIDLEPELKGLKFDPAIVDDATKTYKRYVDTSDIPTIMKYYDAMNNEWKTWTLFNPLTFFKYEGRNIVSNLWNYGLSDANFKYMPIAAKIQRYDILRHVHPSPKDFAGKLKLANLNKLTKELEALGFDKLKLDEVLTDAKQLGIFNTGWVAKDFEDGFVEMLSSKHGIRRLNPIQGAKNAAVHIENNPKLALYLDGLANGMDKLDASLRAKKFMFDYGDLSEFERQIMRRVMPFYTWTRKNLPLQLEMLVKRPDKFLPLTNMMRTSNSQDLLTLKYANRELYDSLPVELRRDAETMVFAPTEGLIAASDLAKIGSGSVSEVLTDLMAPWLRVPIELYMNRSFKFKKEISRADGEMQKLMGISMPPKMRYLFINVLPQARMLNSLNKMIFKTQTNQNLTREEELFSGLLGNAYSYTIPYARQLAFYEVKSKLDNIRAGMARAAKSGDARSQRSLEEAWDILTKQLGEIFQ